MAGDTTTATGTGHSVPATPQGGTVQATSINQMMLVLESLLGHTHTYYDDYGSNCNCNCNCTRGSL